MEAIKNPGKSNFKNNIMGEQRIIDHLDFAFQPIVNIHSGSCFGVEALLRNVGSIGFQSIQSFFDKADSLNRLSIIEKLLHQKACKKFETIPFHKNIKFFLNLEKRFFSQNDDFLECFRNLKNLFNIPEANYCLEISEHLPPASLDKIIKNIDSLKKQQFKIALDDFGTGFSGIQFLYKLEPQFVKINRFFIQDLTTNRKKRLFLSNIVNMAHTMSILVIAQGVEDMNEFYLCRDLGCDLVQGYFIQKPTEDIDQIKEVYEQVSRANSYNRRGQNNTRDNISLNDIQKIPPIIIDTPMQEVLNFFRENSRYSFFPVINKQKEPIGIIREKDLKQLVYSLYGMELIKNKSLDFSLTRFIKPLPLAETTTSINKILEMYSLAKTPEGILIIKDYKYLGFLSAELLLKNIYEQDLEKARDQNPLTRLPGNFSVNKHISTTLSNTRNSYSFVYFDFNFFKPYNDVYGFRAGDRAILLFSDLLKKHFNKKSYFIAHIGGDDFFVSLKNTTPRQVTESVRHIQEIFKDQIKTLYNDIDRFNGFIMAKDRNREVKCFDLLSVSAAVYHLPSERAIKSIEEISENLSLIKKQSKTALSHFAEYFC